MPRWNRVKSTFIPSKTQNVFSSSAKYHFPAFHSYLISSLCTSFPPPLVFIHGCETGSAPAYHPLHVIARRWEAICGLYFFNGFCHPPEQLLGIACIVVQAAAAGVLATWRTCGSVRSRPGARF